ncbi:signal peptidase I [Rhodococcus sp. NPDC055112]
MKSDRGRTGREIALNVGAIAGLICVLAAAASFFFGIKPLIFRSGSMSPDITTGSLALSHNVPASDLEVGDVVSVLNEQGTRITHRVKEIVSSNADTSVLILKGDANQDADISPYTVTEADRVFFSLPGLGYAVAWLSSPLAIFLGGAFVGGLMVIAFRPAGRTDDDDPGNGSGTPNSAESMNSEPNPVAHGDFDDAPTQQFEMPARHGTAIRALLPARTLMVLGAAGLTAFGGTAVGTTAAFSDSAIATSSFSSAANLIPTVGSSGCGDVTVSGIHYGARVNWPHIGSPYRYRVLVRQDNGVVSHTSNIIDPGAMAAGGNLTYTIGDAQVGSHTGWAYTAEIHTVNLAGEQSTGWRGSRLWQPTIWNVKCDGQTQSSSLAASDSGTMAARMAAPETTTTTVTAPPSTTPPSTTTTTAPPTTTAEQPKATTTVPSTTTSTTSPTTTTEVPKLTTTAPTTTTTVPPAPTTNEAEAAEAPAPAPSGGLTLANRSDSGTYAAQVSPSQIVITDKAGSTVSTIQVGTTAIVKWADGSDVLWIADGGALYRVDSSGGWTKTKVDPETGDLPAEIAALVK